MLFIAFALVLAAGAATAGEGAGRLPPITKECIFSRSIYDWAVLDRRNLIVWAPGRHSPYHIELDQPCDQLPWTHTIAFVDRQGDERICGFGGDSIVVDGTFPERCTVGAIHRLTPQEAKDLMQAFRERREAARQRSEP